MNHTEKRIYLIKNLLAEQTQYGNMGIPDDDQEQKDLLRSLMNVRPAAPVSKAFAAVQDEYLQEAIREQGVTELSELSPVEDGLYLWKGDITTLRCGAIVNAANAGLTGCFLPLHKCIDNCIHTYAGVQLRYKCAEIIESQGHEEPTGQAKITPAYNLPCQYILHTVGPIVSGRLTPAHEEQLASCYRACLSQAEEHGVESVAFCCISTGVFGFPRERAAEIAVETVREYRSANSSETAVIFNVFNDTDYRIYRSLLG